MSTVIDSIYVDELVTATCEVFKTMVFTEASPATPEHGRIPPEYAVVATVAFTGKTSGLVAFYSSLDAAKEITAGMLGMEPAAVNGELPDAIGEIANMIAGSFRTRMAHVQGDAWAISVPTVIMGTDFRTKVVSDVQRVLCPFTIKGADVFVELIVTRRTS